MPETKSHLTICARHGWKWTGKGNISNDEIIRRTRIIEHEIYIDRHARKSTYYKRRVTMHRPKKKPARDPVRKADSQDELPETDQRALSV